MSSETWNGTARVPSAVGFMGMLMKTVLSNGGEEDVKPLLAASTRRRAMTYLAFLLLSSVAVRTPAALGMALAAKLLRDLPDESRAVPSMSWKTETKVMSGKGFPGSRSSLVASEISRNVI